MGNNKRFCHSELRIVNWANIDLVSDQEKGLLIAQDF